jgi:hypothetical protein
MSMTLVIPLVIVGVLVAMNVPELRRYFRISRM